MLTATLLICGRNSQSRILPEGSSTLLVKTFSWPNPDQRPRAQRSTSSHSDAANYPLGFHNLRASGATSISDQGFPLGRAF